MQPNSAQPYPYTAFVGIDRSDRKIDITVLNPSGSQLDQRQISSKPNSLKDWILELRKQFPNGQLALCIEQPCANLAAFFIQFDFIDLLLVNPATYRKWHDAFKPSKAHDDITDSAGLAELAQQNHNKLTVWKPDDPHTRQLRSLLESRRAIVDLRTKLNNQLISALKNYFPQALDITGKYLHGRVACDLLTKWPTLQAIQKARPETLRKFYYTRQSRRPQVIEERIRIIDEAIPLTNDPAILEASTLYVKALVSQLNALRASIDKFDREIKALLDTHQDAAIFKSLPGAGPNLASRLLVAFGIDRTRFQSANDVQNFTGISPVRRQSGNKHLVLRRQACPAFIRQSFLEWVGQTILKSTWARAYYDQMKAKGAKTYTARRALAYKWIRIIYRCWKNHEPYDEARYLDTLTLRQSPLAKAVQTPQPTENKA